MAEFEKLQELWQQQPQQLLAPVDTASLRRALGRYGRRQDWINIVKLVLLASVMGWELIHLGRSPFVFAGFAIILVVVVALLTTDWRHQRAIARLDFTAPSAAFVRSALDLLMEQREPFRKYYWPLMLSVVAAMNLMDPGGFDKLFAFPHFAWVMVGSALPFAAYEIGGRLRIQRFEKECRPLVDRLIALLAALEERSE